MKNFKAKELIEKYASGEISPEDAGIVEQWFLKDLQESNFIPNEARMIEAERRIWENMSGHLSEKSKGGTSIALWQKITGAAIVLFILAIGAYFLPYNKKSVANVEVESADLPPGGNKAILTLASGKKIVLDDKTEGNVAQQAGISIIKRKNGEIAYSGQNNQSISAPVYNTMTTPRGGMYRLTLDDGTRVVLNAMSSITYPASFNRVDRSVSIIGEVYFEVAHNKVKPFKVVSGRQVVEVLGTHFNVNSYSDESAVQTTLIEGSVKVTNDKHQTIILRPGQQSRSAQNLTVVNNVDLNEAVAWKDGFFHFNDADVPTILRAMARWYDVTVEYRGTPVKRRFTGDIYRNTPLSKALEIISNLGIHFRIEGGKIIVEQ